MRCEREFAVLNLPYSTHIIIPTGSRLLELTNQNEPVSTKNRSKTVFLKPFFSAANLQEKANLVR